MNNDRKQIINILNSNGNGDVPLAIELSKSLADFELLELCYYLHYHNNNRINIHLKGDKYPNLIGYLNINHIYLEDVTYVPSSILEGGINTIALKYENVESLDFSKISETTNKIIFRYYKYTNEIEGFDVVSETPKLIIYQRI